VRIERSGNQRWLVVKRPADQLWDPIGTSGRKTVSCSPWTKATWASWKPTGPKTAPRFPQDFIRIAGKLLDSLYSTSERDKFRTRLERTPSGETEIFISHRGMIEGVHRRAKRQTVWQPRPLTPNWRPNFCAA
jgi:outer membrane protein assembly factor BamC